MTHKATLTYDNLLVRRAALAFWRRTVGGVFPLALVAASCYAIYLGMTSQHDWMLGVLSASVVFALLMWIAIFFVHYKNGLQKLHDMVPPLAEFTALQDSFIISSSIGTSSMKWSAVVDVWRFEGFWLLLFSRAQFITIPLQTVSPEMQSFLLERVTASGGHIDRSSAT